MEFNAYTYRDFLKDKNCLVIGMARSGISMVKTLSRLGSNVTANDLKNKDELIEAVDALSQYNVNFQLGCKPDEFLEGMDLIILSPSLPIKMPFIKKAMDMGIEVIGEIELAYRLCAGSITAITGTNGKTTTTALVVPTVVNNIIGIINNPMFISTPKKGIIISLPTLGLNHTKVDKISPSPSCPSIFCFGFKPSLCFFTTFI